MRFIVFFLLISTIKSWAAPPAAPSSAVLTAPFVTRLRLDWKDNSSDEVGFEIAYRVGTTGLFSSLGIVGANSIFLELNGASQQTTYQFQIRSFLGPEAAREYSAYAGPSTATTPGYINPPALLPPAVTGVPPAARTLMVGDTSSILSLTGVFTDPDVATAARMTTALGNLDFVFFENITPVTVTNFLGYLNRGDFLNTIFHRAASLATGEHFVVQGGAFRADATASAGPVQPAIINEPRITNLRGTVSMAKLGNDPNSATNQFFISLRNNADILDGQNGGFTVFGRVAGQGMAVADAIAALKRGNYSSTNSALGETPVLTDPAPGVYDSTQLVRFVATAAILPLTLTASSSHSSIVTTGITGTNLTLVPIASGTATVTLTATDLDNQSVISNFQVTVQDGYDMWAAQQSFLLPADSSATADPDKDGLSNLVEFALTSSPLSSGPSQLLPSLNANRLTLTFPLRNALLGTNVLLQSAESPNGPWSVRWTATDGFAHPWIVSHPIIPTLILVTAQDPDPFPPPRRFLRLKVTRP